MFRYGPWLISLLFGLSIVFPGCENRGRQSGTRTARNPGTAPSISRLSDPELEKAIRANLETDSELKAANLSVIAIAERNEVTLSGTVRSHAARDRAIELAKGAKTGILVNDQIDVKPAG